MIVFYDFVVVLFFCVCFIKEIGCGLYGVCVLFVEDMFMFYCVMFDVCVLDVEFGVILIVYWLKGEFVDELVVMFVVVQVLFELVYVQDVVFCLVLILSYNGVCK